MTDDSRRDDRSTRDADVKDARTESGAPRGGAGRRDEVGPTGVYPMSGGIPTGRHLEIRTPAAWGQGDRGAEGYNDSGESELLMRDGQLIGGLSLGPSHNRTIDISHRLPGKALPEANAATPPKRALLLSIPEFGFIVATRAALAAGVGLLASSRLSDEKRRSVGTTLGILGALATIPAVMMLRKARRQIA